jgi:ribosomal protein S18 acetylase RimI-like enzyme
VTSASVRRARGEDAEFLASAILIATRGHLARGWFDIALNQSEQGCLQFLARLTITQAPSWWHYSRFWVAEANAKPVAALSAFRADDAYPLSQQAMSETADALGFPVAEQSLIWKRGAYLFTCDTGTEGNAWTIENIATAPQYRGRGVGFRLIDHALEEGRRLGFEQAQITFFIGNETAERLYTKAGFHLGTEARDPKFEATAGVPGVRRFVRRL